MEKGRIIKAISGFYYVDTGADVIACKARGVFRKQEITPLTGDFVTIEDQTVMEILPRKNQFLRPPAANLDQVLFVVASAEPEPNFFILDQLIAVCEKKEIEPILAITKNDLKDGASFGSVYQKAGFSVYYIDPDGKEDKAVYDRLKGKVTLLVGNTGVGKSTLLNRLFPSLSLKTGEISEKLGRGRHTTRHVEMFPLPEGGYVADTPGFGTVEIGKYEIIKKEELAFCFREFSPYIEACLFKDCSHRTEKGCQVVKAVEEGQISKSRHLSYCALYEEAAKIKDWER